MKKNATPTMKDIMAIITGMKASMFENTRGNRKKPNEAIIIRVPTEIL
jgi:hypothetical protein